MVDVGLSRPLQEEKGKIDRGSRHCCFNRKQVWAGKGIARGA